VVKGLLWSRCCAALVSASSGQVHQSISSQVVMLQAGKRMHRPCALLPTMGQMLRCYSTALEGAYISVYQLLHFARHRVQLHCRCAAPSSLHIATHHKQHQSLRCSRPPTFLAALSMATTSVLSFTSMLNQFLNLAALATSSLASSCRRQAGGMRIRQQLGRGQQQASGAMHKAAISMH
jgi:hypothetical protein